MQRIDIFNMKDQAPPPSSSAFRVQDKVEIAFPDFEASEFLLNEIDILRNTDPSEYVGHKIIPSYVDKDRVYPYEWDTINFSTSAITILEGFNESALHTIKESRKRKK